MAQAIVAQIGSRARIVRAEALLAVRHVITSDRGARGDIRVCVVIVGVVVITVVIVARAEAERDGWTAEPASVVAPVGKVTATAPVAAGPIAVVGGKALAAVGGKVSAADRTAARPVAAAAPADAHVSAAASAETHAAAAVSAVAAHLHLFKDCAALERHVCMDWCRGCGTGPNSTNSHQSGGQKHRASCHHKLHC